MENIQTSSVSLKTRLGVLTGIVVSATVIILTAFFIINSRKAALSSTKDKIKLIAESSSKSIENKVNEALFKIQHNIDYSLFLRKTPGDHRERLYDYYKNELINDPALQGVSLVYKPGSFDNLDSQYAGVPGYYTDGRLCIYWWREGDELARETEVVNFDEELAESGAEWWDIPLKEKRTYIAMDIYEFKGKDILMLSVYLPIKFENEYLGVMGYDYQSDFMQKEALIIKERIFGGNCDVNVLADDGNFAANSVNDTIIMKNIKNIYPENSGFMKLYTDISINDFITQNDTIYLATPVKFAGYDKDWHINIGIPMSVIMSEVNEQLLIQLLAGIILIALSVLIVIILLRRTLKPLVDLKEATETLATGNLQVQIDILQNDEIGSLANAFRIMAIKLKEIVNGIHRGSTQILTGSQQVSKSAQSISQGSNQQASATEQVASSIEEVITAINQNSENAQIARTISKKAEKGIIESQQASQKTIDAMRKISEKTAIITQIAQKTNILAINAAIEAARAGNLGKGFGIVAAEVRNLAESSHLAAADIVELSEETLKMSEISGQILSGIVPDVQKTTALVEEIATASLEQNSGIKQISLAIEQLNSVTLQNSATSEELASSSEELVAQAESLQEAVAFFSTVDTRVIETPEILKLSELEKKPAEYKEHVHKEQELIKTEVKSGMKGININLDSKPDDEFEAF
jgi:methyl-accepting chemotaxis protein